MTIWSIYVHIMRLQIRLRNEKCVRSELSVIYQFPDRKYKDSGMSEINCYLVTPYAVRPLSILVSVMACRFFGNEP